MAANTNVETRLQPYLDHLRKLPFVRQIQVLEQEPKDLTRRLDALIVIRTPRRAPKFHVELKTTHLTYAVAQGVIAQMQRKPDDHWILCAPYVPPKLGRVLTEQGTCFVDEAGNCFLKIGEEHIALIEGRKPPGRGRRGRGMGAPGHQILFALLADPELLNLPVRELARIAGTGKTVVTHVLDRLAADGLIAKGATRRHLLNREQILDRWLAGYAAQVRPRMLTGTFDLPGRGIEEVERHIENALGETLEWAWGGGAAGMRLTNHYRGEETVLHIKQPPANLAQILRAIPAKDGPVTILKTPGEIAFRGVKPRTVHPLLAYTELLTTNNERAVETARLIRERYLWNQE